MLQDLEYENIEIIATIVDKIKNIKKLINYLYLVLRISTKKYLIIVSKYICLIILFLYLLCICIFKKLFEGNIYLNNNFLDK